MSYYPGTNQEPLPRRECCHGLDDVCASSGCLLGIPNGEDADSFAGYCPHCNTGDPGEDYCASCGEAL